MRGNETGSVRSHGVQWGRRRVQSLLWVGVAMAKSECGNDVECMVIDGDKAKGSVVPPQGRQAWGNGRCAQMLLRQSINSSSCRILTLIVVITLCAAVGQQARGEDRNIQICLRHCADSSSC
eukprot:1158590-Pelagomonas_calceolata.AAC.2